MRKYLLAHLRKIEAILDEQPEGLDYGAVLEEHLVQIGFMQHERFIHLIVTFLFSLLMVILLIAFVATGDLRLGLLGAMFFVPVLPYVCHYYFLENNVQKFYKLYDELRELSELYRREDSFNSVPINNIPRPRR